MGYYGMKCLNEHDDPPGEPGDLIALYEAFDDWDPHLIGIYLGLEPIYDAEGPYWTVIDSGGSIRYVRPGAIDAFQVLSTFEGAIG